MDVKLPQLTSIKLKILGLNPDMLGLKVFEFFQYSPVILAHFQL